MWIKVQSTVNLIFEKMQTDLGGKQLVINPMGMFAISSGMHQNPQCGSDPHWPAGNLGENCDTCMKHNKT